MGSSVQIICGTGTGKSSLALGKGIIAAAKGERVILIQFLKGVMNADTSEWLKGLEPEFKVFRFEKQKGTYANLVGEEREEAQINIQNGVSFARKVLSNDQCDMLILDEFLGVIDEQLISMDVAKMLIELSQDKKLIITGNKCPEELMTMADLVTVLENVDK